MKTIIHVNGCNLRLNKKDGGNRPVFTAKNYKENRKGQWCAIHGPSVLRYHPEKKHKSGAVATLYTYAAVDVGMQ